MPSCKSCHQEILFAKTPSGGLMPLDAKRVTVFVLDGVGAIDHTVAGHTPHWTSCPNADQHRKPRPTTRPMGSGGGQGPGDGENGFGT